MGPRRLMTGLFAAVAGVVMVATGAQTASRNRWAAYEHEMQDPINDPADAGAKTEFVMGRRRYRSPRDGWSYSRWGIDCNKSDRQFLMGLQRLTRVHARSIEEIIDIDSDDIVQLAVDVCRRCWRLACFPMRRRRDCASISIAVDS